jgi:hypothetical protein
MLLLLLQCPIIELHAIELLASFFFSLYFFLWRCSYCQRVPLVHLVSLMQGVIETLEHLFGVSKQQISARICLLMEGLYYM